MSSFTMYLLRKKQALTVQAKFSVYFSSDSFRILGASVESARLTLYFLCRICERELQSIWNEDTRKHLGYSQAHNSRSDLPVNDRLA